MDTLKRMHLECSGAEVAWVNPPRPLNFYSCPQRSDILKNLWFAMSGGEAAMLTGPAGLGKTLLCRELLQRLPVTVRSLYVTAPTEERDNGRAFLRMVDATAERVRQLGVDRHAFNNAHRSSSVCAIIIDDAHRLSAAAIERLAQWRHDQMLQGHSVGLLFAGRSDLEQILADERLQLSASQVGVRCQLTAFPQGVTESFIVHWVRTHRVPRVAFSESANRIVHFATGGIPGAIDEVCSRALEAVRRRGKPSVSALIAAQAAWPLTTS